MTLVSIPANPVPEGATTGLLKTPDGAELRFARWAPPPNRKGTVCIFSGRGEFIEEYFETVGDLRRRGFAVVVLDWRGQGHSSRRLRNPFKGYVRDFSEYETDVETLVREVVLPDCPPPFFALAHSMGAAVMIRLAYQGRRWFDRMVLSSPMIDLPGRRSSFPVRAMVRMARYAGLGGQYVPGGGDTLHGSEAYVNNELTTDPVRFARNAAVLERDPTLGTGAPTIAWVDAAFRAMRPFAAHSYAAKIRQPISSWRRATTRSCRTWRSRRSRISCGPARISSSAVPSTNSCRSRTATARNSGRRSTRSCRARRCLGSKRGKTPTSPPVHPARSFNTVSWRCGSPAATIRPPDCAGLPSQVVMTPPAPVMIGISAATS